uniref:Uncharacterized protein n=1 Tax=Arundo donax TaxID=35708 RepID=A0A0A9BRD6_ARUDO
MLCHPMPCSCTHMCRCILYLMPCVVAMPISHKIEVNIV